jgi:hypothetical protein
LIDAQHSNCFAAPDAPGGLEMVDERELEVHADWQLSACLQPMAQSLWHFETTDADCP